MRVVMDFQNWVKSDFRPLFGAEGKDDRQFIITFPADASAESIPRIVAISRRFGALYRQAIEWSHSVRNADVHPVFREATYELAFVGDAALRYFEGFGPKLLSALSSRRGSAKVGTPAKPLEPLDLNLRLPDVERFEKAYATAIERLQSGVASADSPPAAAAAGYLYILTNPSLGNMIKVGKTKRSPRDRIDELSAATGVPTPFVLAFDAYVEDCDAAEGYVHARLERDGYRVAKNREFFNVDLATAISVILEAQKKVTAGDRNRTRQSDG